jgi:heme/copper-type cytochrome/quinol oxidase subunit 2
MRPEVFEKITYQFVEDFGLPDGSVRPTHRRTASAAATVESHGDREEEADGHGDAAGRGAPMAASEDNAHSSATEPDEASRESSSAARAAVVHGDEEARAGDEGEEPIDVYLMALRYSYVPRVLRLEHGVAYRFRMMSIDVNHGASIHSGFAGHIMRRPAQTMVEMVMTFPERGEYMIYCTVYCGEGHSTMKGKIIVE